MKPHLQFLTLIFFSFLVSACSKRAPQELSEKELLPRATPESQGISSQAILTFLDSMDASGTEFHSLMILRNGRVVTEGWWAPYGPEYVHQLYSLSKSFTSTAVGFAVQEGLLNLEDRITKFFPEKLPEKYDPKLDEMTVRNLITMSTGHIGGTMDSLRKGGIDWPAKFMTLPVENEPGLIFQYNTAATYMLSAIIQKLSGQTVEEFLKPRLLEPLGIDKSDWIMDPKGINVGGYGFRVTSEAIAKLGQFYLQKGQWNGMQLLDATWCEQATSKQIPSSASDGDFNAENDWSQGYGFQFWRNTVGGYRADGAFGQFSIVLPDQNLVIAITSESMDMGKTMKLIWKHLLPGIKEGPLDEEPETLAQLNQRLEVLELVPETFNPYSSRTQNISGRTFKMEENEFGLQSISFEFREKVCQLTFEMESGERIVVDNGINAWATGDNDRRNWNEVFTIPGRLANGSELAGYATWQNENTLKVHWQLYETCHGDQLIFNFKKNSLSLSFLNSVAEGNGRLDSRRPITGELIM